MSLHPASSLQAFRLCASLVNVARERTNIIKYRITKCAGQDIKCCTSVKKTPSALSPGLTYNVSCRLPSGSTKSQDKQTFWRLLALKPFYSSEKASLKMQFTKNEDPLWGSRGNTMYTWDLGILPLDSTLQNLFWRTWQCTCKLLPWWGADWDELLHAHLPLGWGWNLVPAGRVCKKNFWITWLQFGFKQKSGISSVGRREEQRRPLLTSNFDHFVPASRSGRLFWRPNLIWV